MQSQNCPALDSPRTHTVRARRARLQVAWQPEETEQCVVAITDKGACAKCNQLPRSGVDQSRSHLQSQDVAGGHQTLHLCNQWHSRVRHKPSSLSPNCLPHCSKHWPSTGEIAPQVQHDDPILPRVRFLQPRRLSLSTQSLARWLVNGCGNTCASASLLA